MANIKALYQNGGIERAMIILTRASEYARKHPDVQATDLQRELSIGYSEAVIVMDWLSDNHEAMPRSTSRLIRCGRRYVLNHPFPSLADMQERLKIGERRAFVLMRELERRGIIRIKTDFEFERVGRMASFDDLVQQMKVLSKKYGGRCEPWLLQRLMYLDPMSSLRLAQYGEEHLGLTWQDRPRELM